MQVTFYSILSDICLANFPTILQMSFCLVCTRAYIFFIYKMLTMTLLGVRIMYDVINL